MDQNTQVANNPTTEQVTNQNSDEQSVQDMAKAIDALTSGFEGMVCPTLDMISTHLTEIKFV